MKTLEKGDVGILGAKHKDDFEPYWQDEKDRLCIVESLPADNSETRLFAADVIGYLVGYASLTNTRSPALLGDRDAGAYELLLSFSSPEAPDGLCAATKTPLRIKDALPRLDTRALKSLH